MQKDIRDLHRRDERAARDAQQNKDEDQPLGFLFFFNLLLVTILIGTLVYSFYSYSQMSTQEQVIYELGQFVQSGAAALLPHDGLQDYYPPQSWHMFHIIHAQRLMYNIRMFFRPNFQGSKHRFEMFGNWNLWSAGTRNTKSMLSTPKLCVSRRAFKKR